MNDAIDAADRANVQVFTIYFKGEEERATTAFPAAGTAAAWAAVAIPAAEAASPAAGAGIPAAVAAAQAAPQRSRVDGKKIMQQIAPRTGGKFFEAKKKDNLDDIYELDRQRASPAIPAYLHARQSRHRRRASTRSFSRPTSPT